MTVLAGDVMTVEGDGFVMFCTDDDVDLFRPVAVPAVGLAAVGHLEHLDGWAEDDPGIWRLI